MQHTRHITRHKKPPGTWNAKQAGYTLVEMAIVLALVGTIATGALSLGSVQHEASKLELTNARLDKIENAIRLHSFAAGYLPCPADPGALPGESNFGVSANCNMTSPPGNIIADGNVWIGAIPTRTLNLPDTTMYDAWLDRFTYAVVRPLAANADDFTNYVAPTNDGVIKIQDRSGTQVTDQNIDTVVAYAVVSHGKDKKGAITRGGVSPVNCGANVTKDDENCNTDHIFVDSRITDNDRTASEHYDDLIRWKTQTYLQPASGSYANACNALNSVRYGRLALDKSGRLYSWGYDTSGKLGNNGTTGDVIDGTRTEVSGNHTDWIVADGDFSTNCGIRGSGGKGTLWCWGDNGWGQLGNNDKPNDSPVPVQEALGFNDWTMLDVESVHVCALRSTGQAYCWGKGGDGRLGDGTATDRPQPTEVDGSHTDWTYIEASHSSSCGIRNGGEAYCWGSNGDGELGDNSTTQRDSPVLVQGGITDWVSLSAETAEFCGLTASGDGYCWGQNTDSEIDVAASDPQTTPYLMTAPNTSWDAIAGMHHATCGISAGRLYCRGLRAGGKIPDGGVWTGTQTSFVEEAGQHTDWISLTSHLCGTRSNGHYYCWGDNDNTPGGNEAAVGDGTIVDKDSPALVVHGQPKLCN